MADTPEKPDTKSAEKAPAKAAPTTPKAEKAHGPLDDAKAAQAGRIAADKKAEEEQAGLTLVPEGPLNGYDHARAQLNSVTDEPEAEA